MMAGREDAIPFSASSSDTPASFATCLTRSCPRELLSRFPSGSEFVPVPTQEDTVSPSPPSFSFETTPPMPPASCTILETAHAAITGSGLSSPILRGETVTRLPESDTAARHDA